MEQHLLIGQIKGGKNISNRQKNHIGGNMYCELIEGINVHKYGAHIFSIQVKKKCEIMQINFV